MAGVNERERERERMINQQTELQGKSSSPGATELIYSGKLRRTHTGTSGPGHWADEQQTRFNHCTRSTSLKEPGCCGLIYMQTGSMATCV